MSYSRILVATDLSEGALQAARVAPQFGHERARYRAVMVAPETWPVDADPNPRRKRLAEGVLTWAREAGLPEPEAFVSIGGVGREVARAAEAFDADLVVTGQRGKSRRRILGSVARSIVRASSRDVLVSRWKGEPFRTILVATDLHEPSRHAAARALALAKRHGAQLEVVHCIDPSVYYDPGVAEASISDEVHRFNLAHLGGLAKEVTIHGRPGAEVARYGATRKADLLVIGNHGAGALERAMLGSAAESIIEKAHCSVLVVRT